MERLDENRVVNQRWINSVIQILGYKGVTVEQVEKIVYYRNT